ncbi:hypothetical protein [Sediminicola sp. 1XM1-17]|uniref:hypothetical protein n=1 Tax=Sediminicola sp. 1XM1-17 TaxID=3127702 RepID=UPI003077C21E
MELDRIDTLMEKYFEATTTVAEEEMLREYFLNEKVAPHLEQYIPLFQFFSMAKEEKYSKQLPLKPRKNYFRWGSVAAVAILVFGIYFGNKYQEQREAEYAYQQTKKALTLLAANFSRGTEKAAYLNEFEVTKQKIYNNN